MFNVVCCLMPILSVSDFFNRLVRRIHPTKMDAVKIGVPVLVVLSIGDGCSTRSKHGGES